MDLEFIVDTPIKISKATRMHTEEESTETPIVHSRVKIIQEFKVKLIERCGGRYLEEVVVSCTESSWSDRED